MSKINKVWIAASLGPLLVTAIFLLLSRIHIPPLPWLPDLPWFGISFLLMGFGLALGVGVASIDTLDISLSKKAFVLIIYVPFAAYTLFWFTLIFVCKVFHDCL